MSDVATEELEDPILKAIIELSTFDGCLVSFGYTFNDEDESFGLIQPTLIQQIKKILDEYPDDGQILKELIQNAEDAGASEIKFLIDHHYYETTNLQYPELKKFQGPALYAYNNAKFTEGDWKGLGMLCDSIKVKDPTKVGRFGLGFKSVFHMTGA
ncbi:Sacsin [Exaiptasia diaphana]|nr:Sacsin [Exaiptasia diaphana]